MVDLNLERITAWNSNHLPIHETGLSKIVRIARDGTNKATVVLPGLEHNSTQLSARNPNLFFSCNVNESIKEADIIFICVNTPTKMYGLGAGASADLGALEAATRTIAKHAKVGAVIVEKSTVPCGTARIISDIVSNPLWLSPFVLVLCTSGYTRHMSRICIHETKHHSKQVADATPSSVSIVPRHRLRSFQILSSSLKALP